MGDNSDQKTDPDQRRDPMASPLPQMPGPTTLGTDAFTKLQKYNALDCLATYNLVDVLKPQLDEHSTRAYQQHLKLQAPALAMMTKGFLVNKTFMSEKREALKKDLEKLRWNLNYISQALIQRDLNPNSGKQLEFFFETCLGVEPIYKMDKGVRKKTWGRDALEKIRDRDPDVAPIIDQIIEYRDRDMLVRVLSIGLEPNGRFRTSFNIAATTTFRWSSSENAFWRGSNMQNITEELRPGFISDPGYKLGNIDLSTGDSRIVALDIFKRLGDARYLDACEGGDLHTAVAKLVWPNLPWTGDAKLDRELAEQPFYRHYDYRFMCKKGGHGTNYFGKPYTLALQMKVLKYQVERFQKAYFAAFGTDNWHIDVIAELQQNSCLTNVFGYRRWFHGRKNDEATWREAIAFLGQSGTAIALNTAILRIFYEVPEVQLLGQVHDSTPFQYPEDKEGDLVPRVMECFNNPITVTHEPKPGQAASVRLGGLTRSHTIPIDCAIGWNWGKYKHDKNPDGLKSWAGVNHDKRKRVYDPGVSILDRRL